MRPIPLPSSMREQPPDHGYLLAINKPPSLSSAQVIRDLQTHFSDSRPFASLVQKTQRTLDAESRHSSKRRKTSSPNLVKMGHGGTLDPMATGVLIIGVGAGTKRLPDFLLCKKTYETTVLFGKSSDTYDIAGKNVAEAPYTHITRELIEQQLAQFRGKIKQVPPIYSALKINGMKAYEYARSGQELPRELESRDMEVTECELLDFYEGGEHDFRWPADEAGEEEKEVARRLLSQSKEPVQEEPTPDEEKRGNSETKDQELDVPASESSSPTIRKASSNNRLSPEAKAALHTHDIPELSSTPCPAPAARISLTVSSGFYVRSFAHDLGRAVGSMGMMASLVRSKQAEFTCNAGETDAMKALTYEELDAGEQVWGPRVESMIEEWTKMHPPSLEEQQKERVRQREREKEREGSRDFTPNRRGGGGYQDRSRRDGGYQDRRLRGGGRGYDRDFDRDRGEKRRRNSSSPE